jgi:hypothetical protein
MDLLLEAFAENNMEICVQGKDSRDTLVFLWNGECFVAWCRGGTFYLDRVCPEGYQTIEENSGLLDVVNAVKHFKAPLQREQVCSEVSAMLSFYGARKSWNGNGERVGALDNNWCYGMAFWGFEFRLGCRRFRLVFHIESQNYTLSELESGQIVNHEEKKKLVEIEEWIYKALFF